MRARPAEPLAAPPPRRPPRAAAGARRSPCSKVPPPASLFSLKPGETALFPLGLKAEQQKTPLGACRGLGGVVCVRGGRYEGEREAPPPCPSPVRPRVALPQPAAARGEGLKSSWFKLGAAKNLKSATRSSHVNIIKQKRGRRSRRRNAACVPLPACCGCSPVSSRFPCLSAHTRGARSSPAG